jgi:hypothetical protein
MRVLGYQDRSEIPDLTIAENLQELCQRLLREAQDNPPISARQWFIAIASAIRDDKSRNVGKILDVLKLHEYRSEPNLGPQAELEMARQNHANICHWLSENIGNELISWEFAFLTFFMAKTLGQEEVAQLLLARLDAY